MANLNVDKKVISHTEEYIFPRALFQIYLPIIINSFLKMFLIVIYVELNTCQTQYQKKENKWQSYGEYHYFSIN